MLKPVIEPLNITFLQVNIIPTCVTISVISNKNLPARILARHNKTLPIDSHIHILVRIGNMIVSRLGDNLCPL